LITSLQLALGLTLFAAGSSLIAVRMSADTAVETAVLFSAVLATANALCSLLLSHLGATRVSTKGFFGAILGGMLLRMGTTLAGFVIGLKVLFLPAVTFAAALLTYTGLFIAAEVALWSRQSFSPRVQS